MPLTVAACAASFDAEPPAEEAGDGETPMDAHRLQLQWQGRPVSVRRRQPNFRATTSASAVRQLNGLNFLHSGEPVATTRPPSGRTRCTPASRRACPTGVLNNSLARRMANLSMSR